MALLSKDTGGGGGFEPVPEGTHIARCTIVADMGTQETQYGNKQKVYLGFEVPGERVKWKDQEGKEHEGPALIGAVYTNSINEKSWLGQHLTSWRGKAFTEDERRGFDLFNVLGVPCMLSVTHNQSGGKTYANIKGIMRLPNGTECPPAENEPVGYTPDDPDKKGNLTKLPNWLQDKCKAGARSSSAEDEYLADKDYSKPPEGFDDINDIPFMRRETW